MNYSDSHDYDGRPRVWWPDDYSKTDQLLAELVRVHGWDYAERLLEQDAAMRDAAEQAAKKTTRQQPKSPSMKEACYADFV
jgi:hypothetical protein